MRRALLLIAALLMAGRASGARAASPSPVYPVIALPPADSLPGPRGSWFCLAENLSCARHDAFWQETYVGSPATATTLVTFAPLGPGFLAERRLAEAVLWAWHSEVGRGLLQAAAAWGVTLVVVPPAVVRWANADYEPRTHTIRFSALVAPIASWLLGNTLVHELTHVQQDAAGQRFGAGLALCVAAELPARANEVIYARFVTAQMGGLPTLADVTATRSAEDSLLFAGLLGLLAIPDLAEAEAGWCRAGLS